MAADDRRIDEFATLEELQDDDLLLASSEQDTYNVKASSLKQYVSSEATEAKTAAEAARAAAETATSNAQTATETAQSALDMAEGAKDTADRAKSDAAAAQTAATGAQTAAQNAQAAATNANAAATQAAGNAAAAATAAQTANDTANDALDAVEELAESMTELGIDKDDLGLEQDEESGLVYPTYKGERSINGIPLAGGGGGGGGGATSVCRVRNLLPGTTFTVPYTNGTCSCPISFSFESLYTDNQEPTGSGTAVYYVGGAVKLTETIEQGDHTIDLGAYLTAGKENNIRVAVTDQEGATKSIAYKVTVSQNYIESSFPALSKQTGSFQIAYTPVGSGEKTVYFEIDGDDSIIEPKVVTSSNRVQYQTIPALEHGAHTISVYMKTVLEGHTEPITSNTLVFDVAAIEVGNNTPILLISSTATSTKQYEAFELPFIAYTPGSSRSTVKCYVDNALKTTLNVSGDATSWPYTFMEDGTYTLKLESGEQEATQQVTVSEVVLNASAETEGLKFYFTPANRSNNEPVPGQYSFTNEDGDTYGLTFNNMRFTNDGWTGHSLKIGVGSSVDCNYKPFLTDVTSTVGKTIELNFKVNSVYNYGNNVISCFANNKGIQITPNVGGMAINSTDGVEIQFNDDTEVRLSFVITARNSANEGKEQLVYVFANGIPSGIIKYSINDSFAQLDAAGIHIGSNSAAIELYTIRCYEVALSIYGILDNFIVDSPDPNTMLARDNRNNIFDENGEVDYDKLPDETPYMIISCAELPQYKGDKKTGVSGRFVDKQHPALSFTFTGAEFDVQGTSSAGYYIKNFKAKYKGGIVDNEGNTQSKYALNGSDVDVPVNAFCLKADVASSEGANNVVLMKIWEDTTPAKTPPQEVDARVRQTVNSKPIVVFWENTTTGELTFQGKYNFNNDKGTADTFGFVDNAEHTCQSWEFKDNGLLLTEFKTDDFESIDDNGNPVWQTAFEARFPDGFEDITRLKRVVGWVASTYREAATGNALTQSVTYDGTTYTHDTAAYRLAKFKAEFEDYFVKDNVLWYYCYTDLFLMVDSRAKNQFLTTYDGTHWLFLPYDGDTALGINNLGALKFGYWLEDTDTVGGADVYNGQRSVLWNNVRDAFKDDIIALITSNKIDKSKLSYANLAAAFNNHQAAWSEAVFCADTDVKYLKPYLATSDADYLDKAQGSKRTQRDYWLSHRLAYWFSKYHIASDIAFSQDEPNFIVFRMSEPSSEDNVETLEAVPFDMKLTVTPYLKQYVNVQWGGSASATDRASLQQVKVEANAPQVFTASLDTGRDSTVYVFGAQSIKDIGNLSAMYPQSVNIAAAINLEQLIIGNATEGYKNEGLTTLNIGNNRKLKVIDVRNCVNLTGTITAGSCDNLEEIYADGTKITSVSFPATGALKKVSLPATITSLMLKDQTSITDFDIAGYANLTALYLDNCPSIDALTVLAEATNLTNVYLANIDWELPSTALLDRLLQLGGIPESGEGSTLQSVLTGTVHVPSITSSQKAAYREAWGDSLTITADVEIPQYAVTFVDDAGNTLYTEYVNRGEMAIEPVAAGLIPAPTKASTVDTVYTFAGWTGINFEAPVARDTTVTATFDSATRQYTVTFKVEGTVVQTDTVDVHSSVVYEGTDSPSKQDGEVGMVYYLFDGWDADTSDVVQDMVVNAVFLTCTPPANIVDMDAFAAAAEAEGKVPFFYTNFNEIYPEGKDGVEPRVSAYTFEEFYALQKSPLYKSYFMNEDGSLRYGECIEIWLDDNRGNIVTDIRITAWNNAFNHFERSDGSGMAHVSWDLKYCLNTQRRINATNTNVGGWYDPENNRTELRNWLNNRMIKALPTRIQQLFTRVKVISSTGEGKSDSWDITTANDKLYLLGSTDIFGSATAPYKWEVSENAEKGDGMTTYQCPLYAIANNRIKRIANSSGSTCYWWARSPDAGNSSYFVNVNTGGSSSSSNANISNGVAFGFSIG